MYSASTYVKMKIDHKKEEAKIESIGGSVNGYSDPSLNSELKTAYNNEREPSLDVPKDRDRIILYSIVYGFFKKLRKRKYKKI
jgi:hypothetical protein